MFEYPHHPQLINSTDDYLLYRSAYDGGEDFKRAYLVQHPTEKADEFTARYNYTYVPSLAKAAINDIKNNICQRLNSVQRTFECKSYTAAVVGQNRGVDGRRSTMNSFIGSEVLPELLVMGKVGIYVDRGITFRNPPYLCVYQAEDILNWHYDEDNNLDALYLRSSVDTISEDMLVTETYTEYRYFRRTETGVQVKIINDSNNETEEYELDIPEIPFVMLELTCPLMRDIAQYQVALMNLSSADLYFAIDSNHPIYVEQQEVTEIIAKALAKTDDSTEDQTDTVDLGPKRGRVYGKGMDKPGYITPPTEALEASLSKQEVMKNEIREILNLTITNLEPKRESAESKSYDLRSLESGLSVIGSELEYGERMLAYFWSLYEGEESPTVFYPRDYSLKTESERREEAKAILELLPKLPSITYQRSIAKLVVEALLGYHVTDIIINKINDELDKAKIIAVDPEQLREDVVEGILSHGTCAEIRLYGRKEAETANIEHADRLARIAESQSTGGARGVDDLGTSKDGSDEKELATRSVAGDNTRGEGNESTSDE